MLRCSLLAFLSFHIVNGTSIYATRTQGNEQAFAEISRLDTSGRVFGHIAPLWHSQTLYWARLGMQETVEICQFIPETGQIQCQDTLRPHILSLVGNETGVYASLSEGTEWQVVPLN